MAQVKRRIDVTRKAAATNDRNFRTFLLMSQLEARAIGARIALARNEAGLTQEELSDLAHGFKKRSLQDYETGVTIPFKHLREISSLLDRPVEWFLHGDPDQPSAEDWRMVREEIAQLADVLGRIESRLDERAAED